MRVLFAVNTPYQMIVALQLTSTEYQNDEVDVLVTDNIAQYISIAEKAKQSGAFNCVYTMKAKGKKWPSWKYTALGFIYNKEIYRLFPAIKNNKYDIFLFANSGGVSECIATLLRKMQHTSLCMYEDGFVAYSDFYYKEIESAIYPNNLKSKLIYLHTKRAPFYIEKYYVFNPELLKNWKFPFEIREIKKIDQETIPILNSVFDYEKTHENYDFDYIFFEESYFADGQEVGDVDIVEAIANIVGKENIKIKIHPRNPENRFEKLGFETNKETSTPWEVIALNINLQGKKLITISSGSSITSYFISGKKADKSILLYEMEGINRSKLTPSLVVFDKICKNDSYFVYPHTMDELKNILLEKKELI